MAVLPAAPSPQPITRARFVAPEHITLNNGVPVYLVGGAADPIVRIEAVFPAGRRWELNPGVSAAAGRLMSEGAEGLSGSAIAETVERYGATLKVRGGYDYINLQLHGLNRHLPQLLPLVQGIVQRASYPEKEVANYIRNNRQKLRIREQKVDYLADNAMREALFGPVNCYGYKMESETFAALTREALLDHHRRTVASGRPFIIAAGQTGPEVLRFLDEAFGQVPCSEPALPPPTPAQARAGRVWHMTKSGSVQSALRFARPIMDKSHADYPDFFVLNTIFGGYFGSRLMSNIREDKGYTYGIYSGMTHLRDAAYLYISSEVGSHVCEAAIAEVYAEMRRLREEPVALEELELVRNYLAGTILGSIDGPFRNADTVRGIVQAGLSMDFVQHLVDALHSVSPQRLQELANRYLAEETLMEVVVGWPEASEVQNT
jgi:zinc protease